MVQTSNLTWAWHWHGGAALIIFLALSLYVRGRRRQDTGAGRPRLFFAGMLLLILVWLSPLYALSTQLFSVRVLQRILLIGLIPFFIVLSNPAPVFMAGLPAATRRRLHGLEHARPRLWQTLLGLTKPSFVWIFFVSIMWLWYDEKLHDLTLRYGWLHSLELTLILIAAFLYWWHILAVAPQLHAPMHPVMRILYAFIGSGPVKLVGFILLFSTESIYNYPASLQFVGLDLTDQNLGGILIWTVGGIVFTWTAVYLARQWMSLEDDKPYLPHHYWSNQEAMLAPGLSKSAGTRRQPGWSAEKTDT